MIFQRNTPVQAEGSGKKLEKKFETSIFGE